MPEHIIFESVARRLEAGTYSPCLAANLRARMPVAAPQRPVASLPVRVATIVAPYVGSALLGLALAAAFMVQP